MKPAATARAPDVGVDAEREQASGHGPREQLEDGHARVMRVVVSPLRHAGQDATPRRDSPEKPSGAADLYRCAAHAHRRREGDQAAGVPGRADAGRRTRARAARPRGDRRDGRGRRERLPRHGLRGQRRTHRHGRRGLGAGRAAAQGEGADRARVRPPARGARPLHVPPHRRRRAADAGARRQRDRRRRLRDRRDGRPARCRCSRR